MDSHTNTISRQSMIKEIITLDQVAPHTEVVIRNIKQYSSDMNRLMEMGLIPGEKVKVVQTAPLGDPIEVSVMGYKLCIRKSEASNIEVVYASDY